MADWTERAFDLVSDLSKQVITLSTGMIALGITFHKDFLGSGDEPATRWLLVLSWSAFILAVLAAIATLMTTTGVQSKATEEVPPDPYASNLRTVGGAQLMLFGLGVALTVAAGVVAL